MIKLVAIDLDGTLLNSHRQISEENKNAIQDTINKGVFVVLATGRSLEGVNDILQELNINDGYVITYNGAVVYSIKNNEIILKHSLNFDDYLIVEKFSKKLNVHMHFFANNTVYTHNRNISRYTVTECYNLKMPLCCISSDEISADIDIIKLMYIDEPDVLTNAIANLQKLEPSLFARFTAVKSAPYFFEFLNNKASKGNAIEMLTNKLNIAVDEVMAIGDEENDESMLKFAYHSVAMGNATDKIKKLSRYQTLTNNEHGVAHALKQFLK